MLVYVVSGIHLTFKLTGMECTGLFKDFTKMNHSCISNTSCIQSNNTISVNVAADRDIKKGEEITNSYINHSIKNRNTQISHQKDNIDNLNYLNSKLTKKQRYSELRQYLFECHCTLCESEVIDSDEDSNDSYDMN